MNEFTAAEKNVASALRLGTFVPVTVSECVGADDARASGTMGLYELTVFVHVAAAVTLLSGSVVASPGVRGAVRRARTTQEVRAYMSLGGPLLVLEPAAAMVVLASGIYLTSVADFWDQGWVQASIAFWIVNAIVAGVAVKPAIGQVAAAAGAAADGPVDQHLDTLRRSSRWSRGGDLLMANDIAMLYVMTMKTELAGSLLAVAVTVMAIAAARAITRGLHRSIVVDQTHTARS